MATETLGASLRALRESRGLTLGELARRAGVTRASLQHWEAGRHAPAGPALARTLDALEADGRLRARLIAANDPRHARVELAHSPLGAPVDVGMVLGAMRRRRGATQADLARRIGATQGAVAKWESGDSAPSVGTIHQIGFAMGATVEETLALASARATEPSGVPEDVPTVQNLIQRAFLCPPALYEVVSLGWEAELWRRAARAERWESMLCRVIAYRADWFILEDRLAEIPALARRAMRMATTPEALAHSVPAVGALAHVEKRRGKSMEGSVQAAEAWAARIPDSPMRAWVLRTQAMGLAALGRGEEGVALAARSFDIDEKCDDRSHDRDTRLWRRQTLAMCEAYLWAGQPRKAARRLGDVPDPRIHPLFHIQVRHANGWPAPESEVERLSDWVARGEHYGNRKMQGEVTRARRLQARLTKATGGKG